MKYEYQFLLGEMLIDIERCMKADLPELESVEACFWIVKEYLEKLKALAKNGTFKNENEEIDFFRNVKPQFTCYVEFFILLSRAILFMPAKNPATGSISAGSESDTIIFWEKEEKKFKLFYKKNEDFINYYESGERNKDNNYFLRKNNDTKYIPVTYVYDVDKNYRSPYGHLIGMYMAHRLYNEYVKEKLDSLKFFLVPSGKSFSEAIKMQFRKNLFKRPATGISIILHKLNNIIVSIRNPSAIPGQEKKESSDFGDMPEEMNPGF